jgi:hypothetical protein
MRPPRTKADKKLIQEAIKNSPGLSLTRSKSNKRSIFNTPLFNQEEKQTKLF